MRLPFPTRLPVQKTLLFAVLVFIAQQIQHTDLAFSLLFCFYILLSVLAFNYAGGFSRAPGAYIFWFALLTCILGGLWKIVLGEPGDSNLQAPSTTMAVYLVSMLVIMLATFINKRLVGSPKGLAAVVRADDVNLGIASLGCLITYQIATFSTWFLPGGSGSVASIILQLNIFLPISILLGTIYTIRTSGGTRSVNPVTLFASIQMFVFYGLIGFSKQGLLTPIVCWGVAAASQRYRLRLWQVVLLIAFGIYSVMVLGPMSQMARQHSSEGLSMMDSFKLSIDLLSHPIKLREAAKDNLSPEGTTPGFAGSYFNTSQGLLDRLTIIKADDRLVSYTNQGHTEGTFRVLYYFINWIPHFILPNKEALVPPGITAPGNYYAHETGGLLSPDDFSTGISFSPGAEAFHLGMWLGIVLAGGLAWTLLFISVDVICGDLRESPYGLFAMVAFAHVAPESLLAGLFYFIFFSNIGIIVAIVFCTYFAPILGTLLSGNLDMRKYGAKQALVPDIP